MRVNERIRVPEVLLIGADGEQVGTIPLQEAMDLATKEELDLVEVAPDAKPPVCKIMDYRRYAFEQKRKLKESRKKTRTLEMKETRLRPNIDPHDFGIRVKRLRTFLEKGHKVKVMMRYRPREMRHYEIGTKVLKKMAESLNDVAEVDTQARTKTQARMQVIVLTPRKTKPKKEEEAPPAQ